jgi:FtsZ-binding cell division protein ZapB
MEKNKYTLNLSNIRTKIRTYQEQGKDVVFSSIFITGKEKTKLVDRAPVGQLSLITKNLKCENPDKIRIELYDGKENPNPLWLKELILTPPEPETELELLGFKGLGEAEINRIVDDRFKERQRIIEYEFLKERVMELTEENEELKDLIEELENENTHFEQELESKKQIKYYAGMLGDIFESFGISKDRIKKPIAELMGINETDERAKSIEAKTDSSGIVDEPKSFPSEDEQKRTEIISLIAEYLKTTSNKTLTNVFSIFSEIEADNTIADKIIQYINTLKTENHDNV